MISADSDDAWLMDCADLYSVAPRPGTSPIIPDMDKDGLKDGIESYTGAGEILASAATRLENGPALSPGKPRSEPCASSSSTTQ